MPQMQAVVDLLGQRGLRGRVDVVVGGAPVTPEFAGRIGADGYAPNAGEAGSLIQGLRVRRTGIRSVTDRRIVEVQTLRHPSHRHLLHVVLRAADGATGLGETFWASGAVESYVHELLAPRVLGLSAGTPARIREECSKNIYGSRRAAGPASVETAAASALDIAAGDLAARREGAPLAGFLGGDHIREEVDTYNTCCDPDHDWVVAGDGPHWDYTAYLEDPRGLAEELLADGFTLMKVFHFKPGENLDEGIELVREAASLPGMSVAVDLYDQFNEEEGGRLARALDDLGLAWIEDPFTPTTVQDLTELARTLATPICSGESLAGRAAFLRLASEGGVGLLHCDISWSGGVSGALEAAAAAADGGLPITFHDCTGPIAWATGIHGHGCALTEAHQATCHTRITSTIK